MRVLLDTNLWSSIGDEGVGREFGEIMCSAGFSVLLSPSTLLEVLNITNTEARHRIATTLAKGPWTRLRTEAAAESAEVVAEVKRLRPHWMRSRPDTAKNASLTTFWMKNIWRAVAEDSTPFLDYLGRRRAVVNQIVGEQRAQREEFLEHKPILRPLTALRGWSPPGSPESYLRGWNGEAVELWRIASRDVWWRALVTVTGRSPVTRADTTLADWLGAFVDLAALRVDPDDFTCFWLSDVALEAVPRQWIRWAVHLLQADQKIGRGNPVDEQHSSYLTECDLFLNGGCPICQRA